VPSFFASRPAELLQPLSLPLFLPKSSRERPMDPSSGVRLTVKSNHFFCSSAAYRVNLREVCIPHAHYTLLCTMLLQPMFCFRADISVVVGSCLVSLGTFLGGSFLSTRLLKSSLRFGFRRIGRSNRIPFFVYHNLVCETASILFFVVTADAAPAFEFFPTVAEFGISTRMALIPAETQQLRYLNSQRVSV